jgi:hypothetical protein
MAGSGVYASSGDGGTAAVATLDGGPIALDL